MSDTTAASHFDLSTTHPAAIPGIPLSLRAGLSIAARMEIGALTVVLPDGRRIRSAGGLPGPRAVIEAHNPGFARRYVTGGALGFAEGYIDGEWSTPDLTRVLEYFARNIEALSSSWRGRWLTAATARIGHVLNRNTRAGARRNIQAHYDLGNAFYRLWLDPTMTYSAARFLRANQDLASAQTEKYRALARRIGLERGHHVLEIGCGWGGFAEFAAREIGARVTGITISREQFEFAQRRMHEAGLAEQVEIRLVDYRDVEGTFDRIASIEMFEAVGEAYWPSYFATLAARLKPGGIAGLQIITIDDDMFPRYRRGADFIQAYVFPGGMLPSIAALRAQVADAGLVWRDTAAFALDYADTLARWQRTFLSCWEDVEALGFDERFKRIWRYYLAYCEAGFRAGTIDVVQLSLSRP